MSLCWQTYSEKTCSLSLSTLCCMLCNIFISTVHATRVIIKVRTVCMPCMCRSLTGGFWRLRAVVVVYIVVHWLVLYPLDFLDQNKYNTIQYKRSALSPMFAELFSENPSPNCWSMWVLGYMNVGNVNQNVKVVILSLIVKVKVTS
jgi:hypothetical protein